MHRKKNECKHFRRLYTHMCASSNNSFSTPTDAQRAKALGDTYQVSNFEANINNYLVVIKNDENSFLENPSR